MRRSPTGSSSWPGSTRRRPTCWQRKRPQIRRSRPADRIAGRWRRRRGVELGAECPRAVRRVLARSGLRLPTAWKEKPAAFGAAGSSRSTQRRVLIAPISPAQALSARHQHAVDHVDDAVRLEHVLDRDPGGIALGVADGQRLALELDRELFAFDGLELGLAAALVGGLP